MNCFLNLFKWQNAQYKLAEQDLSLLNYIFILTTGISNCESHNNFQKRGFCFAFEADMQSEHSKIVNNLVYIGSWYSVSWILGAA